MGPAARSSWCADVAAGSARRTWWPPTQIQPERLGALDQAGDVGITAQEIVDELPTNGFLPADHGAAGRLVTVDQHLDRLVHHPEHRLRGRLRATGRAPHGRRHRPPQVPGGRQVEVDGLVGVDAGGGGQLAQLSQGGELGGLGSPPLGGGVGQDLQVLAQQIDRHACLGGGPGRHLRHQRGGARVVGAAVRLVVHGLPPVRRDPTLGCRTPATKGPR